MRNLRAILILTSFIAATQTSAQSWQQIGESYSLKAGETAEISDLYWVTNCRSLLTSPPEATIMDGPPGVTATVVEAMVMPRFQQCSRPVKGGKLELKATNVDEQTQSIMTVRIRFQTKDGPREHSFTFNLVLFPPS